MADCILHLLTSAVLSFFALLMTLILQFSLQRFIGVRAKERESEHNRAALLLLLHIPHPVPPASFNFNLPLVHTADLSTHFDA